MTDKKTDRKDEATKAPVDLKDDELERAQAGTGGAGQSPGNRQGRAGITLDVDSSDTIETFTGKN